MPLTFMRYFYIGANLRWLLATIEWPDASPYRAMTEAYQKAFQDAARSNPRLASLRPLGGDTGQDLTFNEETSITLQDDIYTRLLTRISTLSGPIFSSISSSLKDRRPALANVVNHIGSYDHGGVKFGTGKAQLRDSFIVFNLPNDNAANTNATNTNTGRSFPRAGQIREIVLHPRTENGKPIVEPFFVVDEYVPLSAVHEASDPFRQYSDLDTQLFYNHFQPHPHVIALQDIRAHFAALVYCPEEIGQDCIVVRSLDRVSIDWRLSSIAQELGMGKATL
ncbi:hypothetical protein C8Q74DRAFT_1214958 [Fomes fomentarius]|nr:hypothetical protein C8Q74DRAFT_1371903 [Fomes fomentarius]KAI0801333.1 hypothetical protein C8Q74DRAFT_1214958 [Fomes fomentarius]